MRKFDEIISEVFNSQDYCYKGCSVDNCDSFIVQRNQKIFVVLIIEKADFDGNNPKYEYAVYSVSDNCYIAKTTDDYSTLVALFPSLQHFSQTGNTISFIEKIRLTNLFYELIEDVILTKQMNGELYTRYKQYLTDMEQTKSGSVRKVYAFFKEVTVDGTI